MDEFNTCEYNINNMNIYNPNEYKYLSNITCISPIDGRYRDTTIILKDYFSEFALFRYRLRIEIEYFINLCKILPELSNFNKVLFEKLKDIYNNFTFKDCLQIKEIENKTKHDIKALEYFIKNKFIELKIVKYSSFIHFGLTSQDINTSSVMLSIKDSLTNVIIPQINKIKLHLTDLSSQWINIPMLSKTHGQPATPTTVGKELYVFIYRLENELENLKNIKYYTKFGGAVGNFNAHLVSYPSINWINFADEFINNIGLIRHKYTTQISNYDEISYILDNLKRINTIILDLNQDIWFYISNGYFKQKIIENEIGSSTMPHKVNPINFENSEGNLTICNALLECLSRKLPVSRLQRDLTDSTILRNLGSIFGYAIIGYTSIINGLNKITIDEILITKDLEENYIVISEAIQTILRKNGIDNAYELLKDLTRNNGVIDKESMNNFINNLEVSYSLKEELKSIELKNYIGYANLKI